MLNKLRINTHLTVLTLWQHSVRMTQKTHQALVTQEVLTGFTLSVALVGDDKMLIPYFLIY